ncbi:pentapeptide repeat-containing protein [Brasilonema sp. UFV-L1]|uniref:pentapeptide repeat-containing protein n=1 Tax=Brasilonema sp. UFV-L1 TaxID=2234130 RepID=UPI00145E2CDD|nr:pentapeptide repeat-containing protein [Brasilonema sp. UFV-L1]NMG09959.1 low-complexity protein [Brasilonema sp. UFV-L1]
MSAKKTDVLRNWLIAIAATLILSPIVFFITFYQMEGLSNQQKIENRTQALSTTAIFFLGLAVMMNAYVGAKRTQAVQESAIAAQKRNEIETKNVHLAQERLITERFMTAITQLGHQSVATRTGAIYALERVAQDCPQQYWTIIEILTAFVRENPADKPQEEKTQQTPARISTDIQAALRVITRRDAEKDQPNQKIDLRYAQMRGADLHKANLQQADLRGANLCEANLQEANLCEADLDGAKLSGSILYEANLQSTNLTNANLCGANLNCAQVGGANLRAANLTGASLRGANLQRANLYKANLQGSNLKVANLQGAKLFLANLQGAKLGKANLQGTGLIGANLQQANLNGANLQQANLNAAKLQQTEFFFANLSEASLRETDLCRANLMGTNLQMAILDEANLCGANLMGANLNMTNLSNVKLEGAILTGVKNLKPYQMTLAQGDVTTRLPENVESPADWTQIS